MPRRKATKTAPLPEGWKVETTVRLNHQLVTPGTELSVKGIRGRVRFIKQVTTSTATWIDVFDRDAHFRSVRPAAVKRVHRISKLRPKKT